MKCLRDQWFGACSHISFQVKDKLWYLTSLAKKKDALLALLDFVGNFYHI